MRRVRRKFFFEIWEGFGAVEKGNAGNIAISRVGDLSISGTGGFI